MQRRTVQSVFDDHHDIFEKAKDCHLKNLEVKLMEEFDQQGLKLGLFLVYYNDGEYSAAITDTIAPLEAKEYLLDVLMINPDYYYKLTGCLGELFNQVKEWWKLSSPNDR